MAMTLAMMLQVLQGQIDILESGGNTQVPVTAITDDSRSVSTGSVFVAVPGERVDGHQFIPAALKAGMTALVMQQPVTGLKITFARDADSRKALGLMGSRFYGDPSALIRMIGVTGTNGKTTTTYVCKALLEALGQQVGLIGTVAYQIGQEILPASHTTPGAL